MKDWRKLSPDDFEIQTPDWIPSLQATVRFERTELTLVIDEAQAANQTFVDCMLALLEGWQQRSSRIAAQTEVYLQRFLPGRRVEPAELVVWAATLYTNDGDPTGGVFSYRVTGDYDDPAYDLDQFDHRSVVELDYPIRNGAVCWTEGNIAATNDFD
ncbi:MAG: hypothetical protein ACF8TS_22720 [Maioricimonas sp. JB049]